MTDSPKQRAIFWWCIIAIYAGCFALTGCESISVNDISLPDTMPSPLPTTTTTTIPPAQPASEALQGFSHATPVTDKLVLEGMHANHVTFSGSPRSWQEGSEEGCHGESHLFVVRNGKWVGGKYDHVRNSTFSRDFKNIHNGYQVWATIKPVRGEAVAHIFINYAKSKRTNAVFTEWK